MSNKLFTAFGALILGVGILAATNQGCGGSSNSGTVSPGDINAICTKSCATAVKCAMGFLTMDTCMSSCTATAQGSSGTTCKNLSAIVAKAQSCADMTDCTAFEACGKTIPDCDTSGTAGTSGGAGTGGSAGTSGGGTTGSAGTTGSGGTTGAAGFNLDGGFPFDANIFLDGGGATCDSACVKADTCCNALKTAGAATAGTCNWKAMCDSGSTPPNGCNGYLVGAQLIAQFSNVTVPDACK